MRGFLRDLAVFLGLQALVLAGLQGFYSRTVLGDHYLAAWRDKQARLASSPPPRLLLVGGSSLAFGVDSQTLESAARRPVVNLGLHAGLGAEFILRQGEAAARQGDLVVLTLEYPLLIPWDRGHAATLLELLAMSPDAARFVAPRVLPSLLDEGLQLIGKRPRALALWAGGALPGPGEIYARSAFDGRGDAVGHLRLGSSDGGGRHGGLPPLPEEALLETIARLNLFASRVRDRGARSAFALAPVPDDDRQRQAARLQAFVTLLRRELGMPLLEVPLSYPRSEFFDTAYHLTASGRRLRTQALAEGLRGAGLLQPVDGGR